MDFEVAVSESESEEAKEVRALNGDPAPKRRRRHGRMMPDVSFSTGLIGAPIPVEIRCEEFSSATVPSGEPISVDISTVADFEPVDAELRPSTGFIPPVETAIESVPKTQRVTGDVAKFSPSNGADGSWREPIGQTVLSSNGLAAGFIPPAAAELEGKTEDGEEKAVPNVTSILKTDRTPKGEDNIEVQEAGGEAGSGAKMEADGTKFCFIIDGDVREQVVGMITFFRKRKFGYGHVRKGF